MARAIHIALLSIVLLVGASVISPATATRGYWFERPPERYTHDGNARIMWADQTSVTQLCRMATGETKDTCEIGDLIIAVNPCDWKSDAYAKKMCHALGHVNGWPGDHPG